MRFLSLFSGIGALDLGLTQAGRVEAALAGVALNTDAIDNAAGVTLNNNVSATGAIYLKNGTLSPNAADRIGNQQDAAPDQERDPTEAFMPFADQLFGDVRGHQADEADVAGQRDCR